MKEAAEYVNPMRKEERLESTENRLDGYNGGVREVSHCMAMPGGRLEADGQLCMYAATMNSAFLDFHFHRFSHASFS